MLWQRPKVKSNHRSVIWQLRWANMGRKAICFNSRNIWRLLFGNRRTPEPFEDWRTFDELFLRPKSLSNLTWQISTSHSGVYLGFSADLHQARCWQRANHALRGIKALNRWRSAHRCCVETKSVSAHFLIQRSQICLFVAEKGWGFKQGTLLRLVLNFTMIQGIKISKEKLGDVLKCKNTPVHRQRRQNI